MQVIELMGKPIGYEALSPTAAVSISGTLLKSTDGLQVRAALVTVEDQSIRYTLDGTAPESDAGNDVGHLATSGTIILLKGVDEVKGFACIEAADASPASVKVTTFA